jgi:hypothetical protein
MVSKMITKYLDGTNTSFYPKMFISHTFVHFYLLSFFAPSFTLLTSLIFIPFRSSRFCDLYCQVLIQLLIGVTAHLEKYMHLLKNYLLFTYIKMDPVEKHFIILMILHINN